MSQESPPLVPGEKRDGQGRGKVLASTWSSAALTQHYLPWQIFVSPLPPRQLPAASCSFPAAKLQGVDSVLPSLWRSGDLRPPHSLPSWFWKLRGLLISPQSFTSLFLCHLSLLSHVLPHFILVSLTSFLPWTQPLGAFLLPPFYPPYCLHPFLPPILLPYSPSPFLFHLLLAFLFPDHLLHPLTLCLPGSRPP